MFNRNIKQKILLSFIPPHIIQYFIDNPAYKKYDNLLKVNHGHVEVINSINAKASPLYRAYVQTNGNTPKFYKSLVDTHMDYNSKFKERTGMTLEEYEQINL